MVFESSKQGRLVGPEEIGDQNFRRVAESLRKDGIEEFELDSAVIDRLVELEDTPFNADSRAIKVLSLAMASHLGQVHPEFALSEEKLRDLSLACHLHDIGKSGPADASIEARRAVISLYSLNRRSGYVGGGEVKIQPQTLVGEVVKERWPEEAENMLALLDSVGGYGKKIMRDFWDAHGYWSYEMLERYPKGVNARVRDIVASHHVLEGVNPKGNNDASLESLMVGAGESYLPFTLIAADKYEAARIRGGKSHKEAMEFLRQKVAVSSLKDKTIAGLVLGTLNEVGEETIQKLMSSGGRG